MIMVFSMEITSNKIEFLWSIKLLQKVKMLLGVDFCENVWDKIVELNSVYSMISVESDDMKRLCKSS